MLKPITGGTRPAPRPYSPVAHTLAVKGAAHPVKSTEPYPNAPQPGSGAGQPAGQPSLVDLSQDPILQQIRAIGQQHIQGAQADELAGRKQALIAYGYDPSLDSLFPDSATKQAAQQNPFSVLANQQHDYQQRTQGLEENLNKGNLFYSGARGTALGENARGYQQQQATSTGNLNDTLGALHRALLGVQSSEQDRETQGLSDAYGRYQPPNVADALAQPAAPAHSVVPQSAVTDGWMNGALHPVPHPTAHRRPLPGRIIGG